MKDNTITAYSADGEAIEIYAQRIDELTDAYIQSLDCEEDIYKPSVFLGLLKFLYLQLFRPNTSLRHNSNSVLINEPPETISGLWDKFCTICYRYRSTPTLLKFSVFSGIDRTTFQTWKDGSYRNANKAYSDTAKKMYVESEAGLETKAVESNGIGAIFALKSNFSWRETAPIAAEVQPTIQHETAEQIAARHSGARLPERPDLSEFD